MLCMDGDPGSSIDLWSPATDVGDDGVGKVVEFASDAFYVLDVSWAIGGIIQPKIDV